MDSKVHGQTETDGRTDRQTGNRRRELTIMMMFFFYNFYYKGWKGELIVLFLKKIFFKDIKQDKLVFHIGPFAGSSTAKEKKSFGSEHKCNCPAAIYVK